MKHVPLFLVARLKNNAISIFLWLLIGVILTSCGAYRITPNLSDGAPVQNAIEHPVEHYENLSLENLHSLGIEPQVIDMGENEYGIYVLWSDEIRKTIADEKIHISFSLWDTKGNFILAMPTIEDKASPFIVTEGYQLRIALVPTASYHDLKLGSSYIATLNPPKTAK